MAGQFSVAPIIVTIERGARSASITVGNEGTDPLQLNISAAAWTQDAEGKDVYEPTTELVFYPKVMTLAAGEQRLIRIGVKGAPPEKEKTFRIFLRPPKGTQPQKERDPDAASKNVSAKLSFTVGFAPPIFYVPAEHRIEGRIETVVFSGGKIHVQVRNTGNMHFRLNTVTVTGRTADGGIAWKREVRGWYLLHGITRSFQTEVAQSDCRKVTRLEIEASSDELVLQKTVEVRPEICLP
jgi:fimbrial chaperone protein